MKYMTKKGISPLIATVLIIGFTVVLAAGFMAWGTPFMKNLFKGTEESAQLQLACAQDVQFDVKSACYDGADGINFIVENNGNRDIKNFSVRLKVTDTNVISGSVPNPNEPNAILSRFGLQTYTVTNADVPGLDVNAALVQEVTLVPVIEIAGKPVTCPQSIQSYSPPVEGEPLALC